MKRKIYGVMIRAARVSILIFLFYEVFAISHQLNDTTEKQFRENSEENTKTDQLRNVQSMNSENKESKIVTQNITDENNTKTKVESSRKNSTITATRIQTIIQTKVVETKIFEHPFSYLHVPITVCKSNGGESDPFLLVVVKSDVNHIGHRMAIRATWGKTKPDLKVVFLLGYSRIMTPFIEMESDKYRDIVQENFVDDYENNTLKTVMGFNWVATHCPETKYVYFVDDDYIVNIKYLWDHLNRLYKDGKHSIFSGCLWINARVDRNPKSKWYVSKDEFSENIWPPYVSGGSMVLSTDIVKKVASTFKYVKPLFIDDVYLGILAKKLGITLEHEARHHPVYIPDRMAYLFASHGYKSPKTLLDDWERYHIKFDMVV